MSKNILILSTGDIHGAYEAAYKIAKFLYEADYKVVLLVKYKTKSDPFIIQITNHTTAPNKKSIVNRVLNKISQKLGIINNAKKNGHYETDDKYCFFTKDEQVTNVPADVILSHLTFIPDLILSSMTDGFCTTTTLLNLFERTNAKIYTWLVDMGPLTGGCHYSWGCKKYESDCTNCPAIVDEAFKDKAYVNLMIKKSNIEKANIKVLAGSGWVKMQAEDSFLFKNQSKIYNTNNCIDTRLMNNNNRSFAKNIFGLNDGDRVLFTGSWNVNDSRKGLVYFLDALNILWQEVDTLLRDKIVILIAGEHYGNNGFLNEIPFRKQMIDYIKDYRLLSLAYQSADIFVCASIEDSGPMMVAEALACGTPVVGFNMGSVNTLVENDYNGYVARLMDSTDLSHGINKVLSMDKETFGRYSSNSVEQINKLASHKVAVKVIEALFND